MVVLLISVLPNPATEQLPKGTFVLEGAIAGKGSAGPQTAAEGRLQGVAHASYSSISVDTAFQMSNVEGIKLYCGIA